MYWNAWLSVAALTVMLQSSTPAMPPPAQPNPCAAPEYRQFDFWVGRWDVTTPGGQQAGANVIERQHGDCVLVENWHGVRGVTGTSLNMYVAAEKQWQQTWVDSSGSLLVLRGGLRDGVMQMTGTGYQPGAANSFNRVTWTPNRDGSVRQLWEVSADRGQSWKVIFDGRYVRR